MSRSYFRLQWFEQTYGGQMFCSETFDDGESQTEVEKIAKTIAQQQRTTVDLYLVHGKNTRKVKEIGQ